MGNNSFQDLPNFQLSWDLLISQGQNRIYNSGEFIFIEEHGLYCLKSGRAKTSVLNFDGNEKILCIFEAPNIIGEIAVIDGEPASCSITALTKVEIVFVTAELVKELIKKDININFLLLNSLTDKVRRSRIESEIMPLHIASRIARVLLDYKKYGLYQFDSKYINTTHEQLAAVIGTTRSQVTIYLNEFVKKGLIKKKRNTIIIQDIEGLKRITG